jgi:hypothetical protein
MTFGKILDSFSTSIGKIFVLEFFDSEYNPSMGGKLVYKNSYFNIKPYGLGKHDYYKLGQLITPNAWSCMLEDINNKNVVIDIPTGSNITIVNN